MLTALAPPTTAPAMPLSEERITALVSKDAQARDIWQDGYMRGLIQGARNAELTQEQRAELAAQAFYRMESHREWLGQFVPATISAAEVEAHRRSPGSCYIPRRGDVRYPQALGRDGK